MPNDRFNRTYAIEVEFDTPMDFAEQDRLACVVLESLVTDFWDCGQIETGKRQGNVPVKVVAYPIDRPRH